MLSDVLTDSHWLFLGAAMAASGASVEARGKDAVPCAELAAAPIARRQSLRRRAAPMEQFWLPHAELVWAPCWLHSQGDARSFFATESGEAP